MNYQDTFISPKVNSSQLVINAVRKNYPISRLEISELTELSIPSVSRIIIKLLEDGYIEEIDSTYSGPGRKTKLITLKKNSVLTSGVEYDGETLRTSIVDEKGKIVIYKKEVIEHFENPVEFCELVYERIKELFEETNISINNLYGIGIALPGIIDTEKGSVHFSAQLGWNGVKLAKIMEQTSGVHTVIDNDIKSAAYAESNKGFARNSKVSVILHFGSGLGSAVIIDGNVFRGVTDSAGELGHITQDINGSLCNCGKIGCLQTNIAKGFIIEEARKVSNIETTKELFSPELRKERWAERIVEKFINYAAISLDTVICSYNPDTVIISGDVIDDSPHLFKEIIDRYEDNFLCDYLIDTYKIVRSDLNGKASLIGAGMLAAEKYFLSV